jgi:hypothetical protein
LGWIFTFWNRFTVAVEEVVVAAVVVAVVVVIAVDDEGV